MEPGSTTTSEPMKYHFTIHKKDDGFWAECWEIPGCMTQGNSEEELVANMQEAIDMCLEEPIESSTIFLANPSDEKCVPWREAFASGIAELSEIGLVIRGARLKADMTQKEVAEKLGIKPHHISEMEHRKRSIGKAMAHRLARIFDVNYRLFL